MRNSPTLTYGAILAGVVVILITAVTVSAAFQTPQSSADTIGSLLVEVRALRIAMERSAIVAPRMQITMSRLEQRTILLSNQLGQIRQDLTKAVANTQQLNEQIQEAQRNLLTASDETEKKGLQQVITASKLQLSEQQSVSSNYACATRSGGYSLRRSRSFSNPTV